MPSRIPARRTKAAAAGTRPSGRTAEARESTQNFSGQQSLWEQPFGGLGGGGGGGTGGFSESLNTPERDIVPEAFTVGNTRIIADKRANAIIVIGNKDVQQKVFAFLDNIDVRSPQVTIHTVIGTLTLNNTEQFGARLHPAQRQQPRTATTTRSTDGTTTTGNSVVQYRRPDWHQRTELCQSAHAKVLCGRSVHLGRGGLSGFFSAGNALDVIVTALESTSHFKVNAIAEHLHEQQQERRHLLG